jgi:predicted dehydrogenase
MQVHEETETKVPQHAFQEPLTLELKEFLTAIKEKRQALVTGKDGLNVIRIAEAVLASSQTGSPIFLAR